MCRVISLLHRLGWPTLEQQCEQDREICCIKDCTTIQHGGNFIQALASYRVPISVHTRGHPQCFHQVTVPVARHLSPLLFPFNHKI